MSRTAGDVTCEMSLGRSDAALFAGGRNPASEIATATVNRVPDMRSLRSVVVGLTVYATGQQSNAYARRAIQRCARKPFIGNEIAGLPTCQGRVPRRSMTSSPSEPTKVVAPPDFKI